MNLEALFWISTLTTAPLWFLMIWLPHWSWTKRIAGSPLIFLPIALLYTINLIPIFDTVIAAFLNPSLTNLATSISQPANALGTWQHLLAFDLVAGYWIYHDGYKRGINRWLMTVSLLLTYLLGPLGMVVYIAARTFATQTEETPSK